MSEISRRDMMVAASGAAMATLLSESACAAEPDRKLGYAIVGLGGYGLGVIIPQFAN